MLDIFDEYLSYLGLEKEAAESTKDKRRRDLSQFSEWMKNSEIEDVQGISRRNIADFVDDLVEDGYAPNTIISKYGSISAALNHLYREGEIQDNPIDRIQRQAITSKARKGMSESEKKAENGPKEYLSKDEIYEMAENASPPKDRNELLIKLLFWTGARVSEVERIDIGGDGTIDGPESDIDSIKPKITLYSPKTDSPRVVSYPPEEINPLLRDWVRNGRLRYKCADDTDRLFVGPKGPLTKSGIERAVDLSAQENSLQEVSRTSKDGREYKLVTPHLLRHSHAMYYHNEENVPLGTLKDHMGHSSTDITESFYAESTEETMVNTFGGN